MSFFIKEANGNLAVALEYLVFNEKQDVSVYANDFLVEQYTASSPEKKTFIIPGYLIKDGNLTIRFELPNAISHNDVGESKNTRVSALKIISLKISKVDE